MDQNLKKIVPFLKVYQSNVVWNIVFNILYALFSTLSFIAMIPMLQVLFEDVEKVAEKPTFT
ncbi:MAG: ABC transporter ATP-binding protein, partial [Flavobacterium sp.]